MFSYNKTLEQVHHVIPWAFRESDIVQKAALEGLFHMNMKGNGKVLAMTVHNGSHPGYDATLRAYLQEIYNPTMSPQDAADEIFAAIQSNNTQLDAGIAINNIILP